MPGPLYYDKTDIKIFILTLLSDVTRPLEYGMISDIICRADLVNPFDFAQCFVELKELGHIREIPGEGGPLFTASASGRSVAAELSDQIDDSIRKKSIVEATRLLAFRYEEATTEATITQEGPCRFLVHCVAKNKEGIALDVTVRVPDRKSAEQLKRHFLDKPEVCMRGIFSVLNGEVDFLLSLTENVNPL